eukprot:4665840-Amphidinium_carterae.1
MDDWFVNASSHSGCNLQGDVVASGSTDSTVSMECGVESSALVVSQIFESWLSVATALLRCCGAWS